MSSNLKKVDAGTMVSTYRVLARQALSLDIGSGGVEDFTIQGVDCRIAVQASHADVAKRREFGGSTLAIEFEADLDLDLFAAARYGFELLEDFLSAITVVSGTTFQPSEFLQVARRDDGGELNCEFLQFLPLPLKHWHERISDEKLKSARDLLAHWDGLESGHRLRRAARNYRFAAGTADDVTAFQDAYIGLETMEKPLATMAGLKPGTEEAKGSCGNCGHEYVRNRTTLVGVRAFVHGDVDLAKADEGRKGDWKLINKLRNDLMHGLVDEEDLGEKPLQALISTMHHLHHAICISSHAPDLAGEKYKLARGGTEFVLFGRYSAPEWPPLTDWAQVVETSSFTWVPHADHDFVPEMSFNNDGVKDLEVGFGRLTQPLSVASLGDIVSTPMEHD